MGAPARTPGIDVSQFQGVIDWAKVAASDTRFAFVRFADGFYRDTRFEENWGGSHGRGLLRGAYHFLRSNLDPTMQAANFIEALAKSEHGIGELPPVLDVEKYDGTPEAIVDHVATWVAVVERELGVRPILYTGWWFWERRVRSAAFGHLALWLAQYTTAPEPPKIPRPWPTWAFWQKANNGRVPGISKRVDLNVFKGDFAALEDFARASRISEVCR